MEKREKGEILKVQGIDEKNLVVYNPSPLGDGVIAARVENADSDFLNRLNKTTGPYNPSCRFFKEKNGVLELIKNAPVFYGFEDPSGTWVEIKGKRKLLFQAVTVDFNSPGGPKIWTNLYLAESIEELSPDNPIALLPGKDNRFTMSETLGDIIWLSRPDKGEAFPGRIGFSRLSVDEVLSASSQMLIKDSKLLKFSITEGVEGESVKVGSNAIYSEIRKDQNGKAKEVFRVILHGATADKKPIEGNIENVEDNPFVSEKIHYKAYMGKIDPENLDEVIKLKQIAEAGDFSVNKDQVKGERYEDVVFPGGIMDGYLYCGVGDRTIGRIRI